MSPAGVEGAEPRGPRPRSYLGGREGGGGRRRAAGPRLLLLGGVVQENFAALVELPHGGRGEAAVASLAASGPRPGRAAALGSAGLSPRRGLPGREGGALPAGAGSPPPAPASPLPPACGGPSPRGPSRAAAPASPPPRLSGVGCGARRAVRTARLLRPGRHLPAAPPHLPPLPAGAGRAAAAMFAGAGERAFPSPRQPARRRPGPDGARGSRPGGA